MNYNAMLNIVSEISLEIIIIIICEFNQGFKGKY